MTNAETHLYSEKNLVGKPISSTYLVMLCRYRNFLENKEFMAASVEAGAFACDYFGSNTSLEKVIPILSQIKALTGHGAFGLDIGRLMHPSDYGVFGYTIMNCQNLQHALETAAEHKLVLNQNLIAECNCTEQETHYTLENKIDSEALKVLVELDFSSAFRFGQILVGPMLGHQIKLESVYFKHAPLGPEELYRKRFRCPVYFGQEENCIRIRNDILNQSIYGANPKLLKVLKAKIADVMLQRGKDKDCLKMQVIRKLRTREGPAFPSSMDMSSAFNMSLSAFKKRLASEGSCYQDICDELRYEISKKLMRRELAIKQIAFELGFASSSAFNKAFKRWSGQSPSQYLKSYG